MRLFVTGASGFIGSAVVPELRGAGHQVLGLARSDAAADRLGALGAEVVPGSLTDLETLHAAAAGSDGVIHLAFRHGDREAASSDRAAIKVLGDALAGTDRPLVVTSGTLVLPAGRVGTEADAPDGAAPAASRAASEHAALGFAGRGVRASVVRLAPCVHERVKRGFVGGLIDAAARAGFAGYLGDGSQRWPALHRQDAAKLYRFAVERAPARSVLHGVGEEGVALRAIAELIADRLDLPVQRVTPDQAAAYFGWLATLAGVDAPASSTTTRALSGWVPSHAGLLDDLAHGDFFATARHAQTAQGRQR
jgi:nucleoside-diphosphate-sugar epimerase